MLSRLHLKHLRMSAVGLTSAVLLLTIACAPVEYPAASWQYVQQQRVANGVQPLEWDAALVAPAQVRAQEIAALGRLDHSGFQAAHDQTIPGRYLCEILGRQPLVDPGYGEAILDAIGQGWIMSQPHRDCALGVSYRRAAIGAAMGLDGWVYEVMWLTD